MGHGSHKEGGSPARPTAPSCMDEGHSKRKEDPQGMVPPPEHNGHTNQNRTHRPQSIPRKTKGARHHSECTCGYRAQTLKHVMIFCPERQESRQQLFRATGSDWKAITQTKRGLNAATKWMIQESVLEQFSLAREEEEEREREEKTELRSLVRGRSHRDPLYVQKNNVH